MKYDVRKFYFFIHLTDSYFELALIDSIFTTDSYKNPQYSNLIYENRCGVNWIFHIVIWPVDQKLFDSQSFAWVDGSVFIFMNFAVVNQINQPTRPLLSALSHLCKAFHALHIKFQFTNSIPLFWPKFYLLYFDSLY